MTNFRQSTFLEYLATAAREPTYSAAFCWLLDEGSPLDCEQKQVLIEELFGQDLGGATEIKVRREWKKLDILLEMKNSTGCHVIGIENKLKATEGDGQLDQYSQNLEAYCTELRETHTTVTAHRFYLTIDGHKPGISDWQPRSYRYLHSALVAAVGTPANNTQGVLEA